jgi:hypothetical protein
MTRCVSRASRIREPAAALVARVVRLHRSVGDASSAANVLLLPLLPFGGRGADALSVDGINRATTRTAAVHLPHKMGFQGKRICVNLINRVAALPKPPYFDANCVADFWMPVDLTCRRGV